jgi:1,2-diacylglycerol 3-beta-galactosyltransferase
MKKKILYIYSDTGGGHRSAATALTHAMEHHKKGAYEQKMVDVFAECSGFLNIFAKLYAPVIKYSPQFWGMLYFWLDDQRKLDQLLKIASPFILQELGRLIKKEKPDLIVSVHPMVNHLTVQAIKDSGKKIPFILIITDPVTLHRAWVTPKVDLCVVATKEAKENAVKYGMPESKIKVVGMPIHPKFALHGKQKEKARAKDDLEPKRFTVLLMGGGEGAGGMYKIVKAVESAKLKKIQLIVIAGRNQKLEKRLKAEAHKFPFPIRIYGFTDQVPEIMAESDMIITKAGPGSIAEALAMNLPIIVTSWLPGQEEGNVEFVIKEGVGHISKEPKRIVKIIKELQNPAEYEKISKNIERVRKPHAALDIASLIIKLL